MPESNPTQAGQCNVAVLGAGDTIASAIIRDLDESDEVTRRELLEVDPLDRAALAAALSDSDVLINAAGPRFNLDAMYACIDAGCHYVDLDGAYDTTIRQLELSEEFERNGLLALLGMSSAPGVTNVMAVAAVAELGGATDHLMITDGRRDLDSGSRVAPARDLPTIAGELAMQPVVLRDGAAVELEPLRAAGLAVFPPPIGDAPTVFVRHSELATFGHSFGCGEVAFRVAPPPDELAMLRELVGADPEAVAAAQAEAPPPSRQSISIQMIDALHENVRVNVSCVTTPHAEWGAGGEVCAITAPAVAAVRLLARGLITARGALPPERCVTPELLFPELERRGMRFEVRTIDDSGPEPGSMA